MKPWDDDGERPTINIPGSVSIGWLQAIPPDFKREELQSIRDRARGLSIQGSLAKTMEERLYQKLADIADQLDAIAARWESDLAKSTITITEPMQGTPYPWVGCKRAGCCGNPPSTGVVYDIGHNPIGDLNT